MTMRTRSRSASASQDLYTVWEHHNKLISLHKDVFMKSKPQQGEDVDWRYQLLEKLMGTVFDLCDSHSDKVCLLDFFCDVLQLLSLCDTSRDHSPLSTDDRDNGVPRDRTRRRRGSPSITRIEYPTVKDLVYACSTRLPYSVSKDGPTTSLIPEEALTDSEFEMGGYNGLYEYGLVPSLLRPKDWSSGIFSLFLGYKDGELCFAYASYVTGFVLCFSVEGPREHLLSTGTHVTEENVLDLLQTVYPNMIWRSFIKSPPLYEILQSIERKCEPSVRSMDIGLVYMKAGQTISECMLNNLKEESAMFANFKSILGITDGFDPENVFDDVFKASRVRWFPATQMSDEEKEKFFVSLECVIIYNEGNTAFDTKAFKNYFPNGKLYIFVEFFPNKEKDKSRVRRFRIMLVQHKETFASFPYLDLPSRSYVYPEETIRDLILTKIFNAIWKLRERMFFLGKTVEDRRRQFLRDFANNIDKKWAAKATKQPPNTSISFSVRKRFTESSSGSDSNSPPPVRSGIARSGKRTPNPVKRERRHPSFNSARSSNDATSAGSQQDDSTASPTQPTKTFSDGSLDTKLFPRFEDDAYEYGVLSKENTLDEWTGEPLLVSSSPNSDMAIEPPAHWSDYFTYQYGLAECRDIYSEEFLPVPHYLFFSFRRGVFSIVSVKHNTKFCEDEKNGLFNHPTGWETFHVPETMMKSQKRVKKWLSSRFPEYRFKTVRHVDSLLTQKISNIEKLVEHKVRKFRVGVLYLKEGVQRNVVDLVENPCRSLSTGFLRFCKGMGIPERFDEDNEFDDVYRGIQIQWFLSSHLSAEDGRKFIGNLQCVIIFKEDPNPIDTATMGSLGKLNQFFMVVEPLTRERLLQMKATQRPEKLVDEEYYRVGFFQKKELRPFEPHTPHGYLFDLQTLRDFLLTKAHNGVVAVRKKSALSSLMFTQPRGAHIREVVMFAEKEWATKIKSSSSSPAERTPPSSPPKRVAFPFAVPITTTTITVTTELNPDGEEDRASPLGTPTITRTTTLATITHATTTTTTTMPYGGAIAEEHPEFLISSDSTCEDSDVGFNYMNNIDSGDVYNSHANNDDGEIFDLEPLEIKTCSMTTTSTTVTETETTTTAVTTATTTPDPTTSDNSDETTPNNPYEPS